MANEFISSFLSRAGVDHIAVAALTRDSFDSIMQPVWSLAEKEFNSSKVLWTPHPDGDKFDFYVVVKMDGKANNFTINADQVSKGKWEIEVEHSPDLSSYDDEGNVVKYVSQEMEAARQMAPVSFEFTSNKSVLSLDFYKEVFTAVKQNAPYTEQSPTLGKSLVRGVDTASRWMSKL